MRTIESDGPGGLFDGCCAGGSVLPSVTGRSSVCAGDDVVDAQGVDVDSFAIIEFGVDR